MAGVQKILCNISITYIFSESIFSFDSKNVTTGSMLFLSLRATVHFNLMKFASIHT